MALICDTSGLYALYDAADDEHEATRYAVESEIGPLLIPVVLLAEVDFLLHSRLGTDAALYFIEAVKQGEFTLVPLMDTDLRSLRADDSVSRHEDRAGGRHDRRSRGETASRRLLSHDQRHSAHSSSRHRPLHLAAGRQGVSGHPATCFDRDDPSTNPGIDEEPPWRRRSRVPDSMVSASFASRSKAVEVSYSGDKPNPDLRAFVERNATPYDPDADAYGVAAFSTGYRDDQGDGDLQHARLLVEEAAHRHQAVCPALYPARRRRARSILRLGRDGPGPLLDGRKAIAIDRSPAATFIAKNHCTPVDPDALRAAFRARPARDPARDRLALRDPLRPLRRQGHDRIHRL